MLLMFGVGLHFSLDDLLSVRVIAMPDTFRARQMLEIARTLNPRIDVVVRSHSAEEAELLRREQGVTVLLGKEALADSMVQHVNAAGTARDAGHG